MAMERNKISCQDSVGAFIAIKDSRAEWSKASGTMARSALHLEDRAKSHCVELNKFKLIPAKW